MYSLLGLMTLIMTLFLIIRMHQQNDPVIKTCATLVLMYNHNNNNNNDHHPCFHVSEGYFWWMSEYIPSTRVYQHPWVKCRNLERRSWRGSSWFMLMKELGFIYAGWEPPFIHHMVKPRLRSRHFRNLTTILQTHMVVLLSLRITPPGCNSSSPSLFLLFSAETTVGER